MSKLSVNRDPIAELHQRIDEATDVLVARHRDRLHCRLGCTDCCIDGLTVFEVEAERIRAHHRRLLAEGTPHAEGACAFLSAEGACRIYAHRPYVCRTQGLPLRWLDELDGQTVELRDICPLNEVGEPIETLAVRHCWTLGPIEGELARLNENKGRVALRELFASSAGA